eukprot:c29137_g1_i1 orf=538-3168(-)
MGSTEEPERKRRHLNHSSIAPALKKQAALPSADEKKVDAAMLQYQNQKLEQQLDVQRSEINALESKCCQLKTKQASHESSLHSVRTAWGMLLEKVEHFAMRATNPASEVSDCCTTSKDVTSDRAPAEEAFLQRLLETGATESSNESNDTVSAELTLKSCRAATLKSVERIVRAIDAQRARREELFMVLKGKLQNDEAGLQVQQIDDSVREVVSLRSAMDSIHLKHKDLASQVRLWRKKTARDQAEMKLLTGELEETIMDLDSTQQKIAAVRNQKDATSGKLIPSVGVKSEASERMEEKPFQDTKALEGAVEEAKSLASLRLKELDEVQKEKGRLAEQLHKAQETLNDDRRITTSHLYIILKEQVEGLKKELEQYQSLMANSMMEQDNAARGDGEAVPKVEEPGENGNTTCEQKLLELELKLQDSISKRNSLSIRLDETSHALERQDEVAEFKVMVSTLEKEMGMMQQQLDKYKEAACGAELLRAEVESTSLLLESKTSECKFYCDKIADQLLESKSLRDEVRLLRESEQELKLILDMYGSESTDSRDLAELKEAECSAWAEVEKLKSALDDHGLELRVRVANEAEAACQLRLATAEAEIFDFRQRLDASERVVMELKEAANMKSEERDAYLAEIETIGQAYEDMQTQNQRLLQQISKRDDYNIKLVSESVKSKQLHTTLIDEKQGLLDYIQHSTSLGESHKQRVARLEQQVKLHLDQLSKTTEDGRRNGNGLEVLKRRLADADKECLSTKVSLEAVQREITQRKDKTGDIIAQLEKERLAKKKVQEDLALLKSKLARTNAQSDGSSLIDKLQDEVKEYKAILKCSVCHDRPKEVVITKCYHLFCTPCIQRNLEIRHRKCPGCGITFGQSDVRTVYI